MSKQVFSKRFEVQELIAEGGMGAVYKALDTKLDRVTALKVVHSHLSSDADFVERFRDEARKTARLQGHPNIVQIFDVANDHGTEYLVMEYFPSTNLRDQLRSQGKFTLRDAINVTRQIAQALSHTHSCNIIHRDIKPANILVNNQKQAKLNDFGTAKALNEVLLSSKGQIIGTINYMSPEQARNKILDGKTDLYSLGMVFYEMITGHNLWRDIPNLTILDKIQSKSTIPPLNFPTDVAEGIRAVLADLLRFDPADRIQNAQGLVERLENLGCIWDDSGETIVKPRIHKPELPEDDKTVAILQPPRSGPSDQKPERPLKQQKKLAKEKASSTPSSTKEMDLNNSESRAKDQVPPYYQIDDAQFTVFRPNTIESNKWYNLLVFAHLSDLPPDSPPEQPTPLETVQQLAAQTLGETIEQFGKLVHDSAYPIPQEGELTIVPLLEDIMINPPQTSFLWLEPVHQEIFRIKAKPEIAGKTVRGTITIFLGSLILAEMKLAIKVVPTGSFSESPPTSTISIKPYRAIFASYSHKDSTIVQEFERHVKATGDRYLIDCVNLRAGQHWKPRLVELIE